MTKNLNYFMRFELVIFTFILINSIHFFLTVKLKLLKLKFKLLSLKFCINLSKACDFDKISKISTNNNTD